MNNGWGQEGHHWKLVVTVAVLGGIAYWYALLQGFVLASGSIMLGVATFLVQWYVIDTPGVEERDRHGP